MKYLEECLDKFYQSCEDMADKRSGRNLTYSMGDIGMSAFSLFFMQCPSFLSFQRSMNEERGRDNTQTLFGMRKIPTDNHIRKMLDGVHPGHFNDQFFHIIEAAKNAGAQVTHNVLDGHTLIALDGSEYYTSDKVCCDNCSKRKLKNGKEEFFHSFLAATVVTPGKPVVFSLPPEFVQPQDGATKQDCEWRAALRWLSSIAPECKGYNPVYLGDDLFARQELCEKILSDGCDFIFTCKEGSHKTLTEYRKGLKAETICEIKKISGKIRTYRYSWLRDLPIRDGEDALKVNWIDVEISMPNGKTTYHSSFITSLIPDKKNIAEMVACARARWKIENETFNVLKNNGYHLEHNFGHGKTTLSSILVVFNLLAFSMHSLCDSVEEMWRKARSLCGARNRLFIHMWNLTVYHLFQNWNILMETIITKEPPAP